MHVSVDRARSVKILHTSNIWCLKDNTGAAIKFSVLEPLLLEHHHLNEANKAVLQTSGCKHDLGNSRQKEFPNFEHKR
jgi:hypothetical protein